jgi:cyclophilin family peptidyl-prolyl cis-trans isomerase/HEAT repeat protein
MLRKIVLVLALAFFASCGREIRILTPEERAILLQKVAEWQDINQNDSIEKMLEDDSFVDDDVEARAMIALANTNDTLINSLFRKYFHEQNPKVRKSAVFAAGILGNPEFFTHLKKDLKCEEDSTVFNYFYEALGRIRHDAVLSYFEKAKLDTPSHHKGIALGLFRLMDRKIFVDKAFELLAKTKNVDAKRILSIYLMRAQVRESLGGIERILSLLSSETDPVVKANLCVLLQAYPDKEDVLINLYQKEKDYRIRLNAVRAMSAKNQEIVRPILLRALKDTSLHVQAMSAEVLSATGANPDELERLSDSTISLQAKSHFWKAIIKADLGGVFSKKLQKRIDTTKNEILKGLLTEAMGMQPANAPYLFNLMKKEKGFVRTSTAYALAAMHFTGTVAFAKPKDKKVITDMVRYAILSGDEALTAVAGAQILPNSNFGYVEVFQKETQALRETLKKIKLPEGIETYQILLNAIALLEGTKVETVKPEYNNPPDFEHLRRIGNNPVLVLHTKKGIIKAKLFPEYAPGTVAYITKLAQEGFYDGKIFHRIVPNFVTQGGCPRGDGWGGTDKTLRTEIGLERFEEGSIGMASAGRDTESCQFFFTHMPTPHLDGKYTVFGKITEGFEVMTRLEIGDKIERAMVEAGK